MRAQPNYFEVVLLKELLFLAVWAKSRLRDTMYHICVIIHFSHVFDTEKDIWQRGSF